MESIWDWFTGVLQYFGLMFKEGNLVFIGLDNAGKTTLLGILKNGHLKQCPPTFQPTSEELLISSIKFTCYDLGGHLEARKIWRNYFPAVNGIVFLVDSMETDRFGEVKEELDGILSNDTISQIPILVLGNKIDHPKAVSEEILRLQLGLQSNVTTGKQTTKKEIKELKRRPVEVFMCSLINRQGFREGFMWLSQYM